jgi:hypothetical protein
MGIGKNACGFTEVQVDLGGGEEVMAQEPLEGRQRDAFLDHLIEKVRRSTYGVTGH